MPEYPHLVERDPPLRGEVRLQARPAGDGVMQGDHAGTFFSSHAVAFGKA
jgi:hypothetical protein